MDEMLNKEKREPRLLGGGRVLEVKCGKSNGLEILSEDGKVLIWITR